MIIVGGCLDYSVEIGEGPRGVDGDRSMRGSARVTAA
jgi:hypothetical protein